MNEFLKMFATAWPGMLLIAGIFGSLFAYLITASARKKTSEADKRLVDTLEANIRAQDELAKTLASASANKEAILLKERAESDARHEAVIAEYRSNLHAVRNELQECSYSAGNYKAELADLRARTDFKPVMEFQQSWYAESQAIHKQMLETMQVIAPVLREVSDVLKRFSKDLPQEVHVTNTPADPVPTTSSQPSAK